MKMYEKKIHTFQHLGKSPRTNRPVTVPAHSTPRNHCHPLRKDPL